MMATSELGDIEASVSNTKEDFLEDKCWVQCRILMTVEFLCLPYFWAGVSDRDGSDS